MRSHLSIVSLAIVLAIVPQAALAHTQLVGGGFLTGLEHPVLGIDHFLAMVSVGVISAQIGGRAIWSVPATFVLAMTLGGLLGMRGVEVPFIESGIAISVVVLGMVIAVHRRMPRLLVYLFVAFFAIFHGHAHGAEMPWTASPLLYALGFVTGTSLIHLFGVLLGYLLTRDDLRLAALRYTGAAVSGVGAHILWLITAA